jgi:hypothetical protein
MLIKRWKLQPVRRCCNGSSIERLVTAKGKYNVKDTFKRVL